MTKKRVRTDILQGMLDMLILKIVSSGPIHGYGIAQQLRSLSQERLLIPQGSLYPGLHRLEDRKMIRGQWKATPSGRRAKYYELTTKGSRRLSEEVAGWQELSNAVSMVLDIT